MSFVQLHNHTHYSLLDGLTKIDELVEAVKKEGSPAVAITDHGVMYGVIEFYQKCLKEGIKPIIGMEGYLAPNSRFDKSSKEDKSNYHLLLLAKNNQGYKNLIKLTTLAHLEGFYYKPRMDWEILDKYKEGLIACSACLGGEIPQLIIAGKKEKAKKRIKEYNNLFGQDNFYLEIQPHPNLEHQEEVNTKLIEYSRELGVPLVATTDSHYINKEDAEVQDILLCLQNKKKIEDKDRMSMMEDDFSLKSNREIKEHFKEVPEALENTLKIAEKCNVEIELGKTQLPYFEVPDNFNEDSYLRKLCQDGLKERYGLSYEDIDQERQERLDFELSVIEKMGWPSYFLIVADFVTWAKKQGIVVGPGRGSAAGSFVSYLLGITNLDPLKYDLIFERFLNPERVSMPDIDLDFADTRRDEVIEYVEEKYGKDRVAQIITFGTMAARAAVRDVGRVLGYSYDYCDKIAKMIPMFSKAKEALENVEELKEIYQSDPYAKQLLDYTQRIEGVARHASTHACGVLITKNPLTDYTPLQYASSSDRSIVSQYSLHPVEDLGLLKMDFLGLKNLTIIESAINIIEKTREVEIKMDEIPLDDDKALELFQKGETTGVFQFESSGMKRYLRELKPSQFEDIIAMVALYRPGPMDWIPDYINGKHGKKKITYLHPKLQPILDKTYGVALYQEQVMQMAQELAGFSMGEADILRKAVGKKIPELLAKQKENFIDGCVKNGINKELAEKIFSFIEPFAGYGFNRSHAACYALIGYQTAYLKAHWPAEFMAALLTADQQNIDRVAIEIEECKNMNIEVLPPDINESFASFTVTRDDKGYDRIRFGLNAIKNVGENIVDVIIQERKDNGPYEDVFDFLDRVTDKDLNKKSLESLIKSGCFDRFSDRGQLLANFDALLNFNKEASKLKDSKQSSLFSDQSFEDFNTPNRVQLSEGSTITQQEKLGWEKELLGLYITEHPFNDYRNYLKDRITPLSELSTSFSDSLISIAGVITVVKKVVTRNSKSMAFVKVEDELSSTEILVFPNLLKTTGEIWEEGKVIICQGKVSDKDQEIKILADKAQQLDLNDINGSLKEFDDQASTSKNFRNNNTNGSDHSYRKQVGANNGNNINTNALKLILNKKLSDQELTTLKEILTSNTGEDKVYFKINYNGSPRYIETGFRVNNSSSLADRIREQFPNVIEVA